MSTTTLTPAPAVDRKAFTAGATRGGVTVLLRLEAGVALAFVGDRLPGLGRWLVGVWPLFSPARSQHVGLPVWPAHRSCRLQHRARLPVPGRSRRRGIRDPCSGALPA